MPEQTEPLDHEEIGYRWTFRGSPLEPASFATAMIHLYRGEVNRSNTWRARLDATTNWAVVSVGAALTFVFGGAQNPHFVLLLVLLLVLTFLFIEGRRYRYYALWSYRVHLMETDFFAPMLVPPFHPSPDWADCLAESLLHPDFPVTLWQAIARRFHRNYIWLITLVLISWGAKLGIHPTPASDWDTLVQRATIGLIPGVWIVGGVGIIFGAMIALAVAVNISITWPKKTPRLLRPLVKILQRMTKPLEAQMRTREQMAIIVTDCGQTIGAQIMEELGRGITALQGTGMYTGKTRDVLLCATTDVQIPHLREIVRRIDPNAFFVVSAVAEVRGRGFRPFDIPS
jgi:uncharacterized membrane protein